MTTPMIHVPDPAHDLYFERIVEVPKELVWKAWTTPEQLMKWFTPAPWKTVECEIDLRPGGAFRTVMESPEGQRFPNAGCYLEVVPNAKLVWTNALEPGYRPSKAFTACPGEDFLFTAVITLASHAVGTKYTAMAIHQTEDGRARHEAMGFAEGWGAALDQMIAMIKGA